MGQTERHPSDLGASEHQDEKPGEPPRPATGGAGTDSEKTQTNPATGEDKGGAKGSEKV